MRPDPRLAPAVAAAATAVAAAAADAAADAAATGKPPAPIKQPYAGRVHEVLPVFLWRELSAFSKDLRMYIQGKEAAMRLDDPGAGA